MRATHLDNRVQPLAISSVSRIRFQLALFGVPGGLAAALALARGAASVVASVLGLVLPRAIGRFGSDPAYGSGPLATIVQDILSLLICFAFVMVLVV